MTNALRYWVNDKSSIEFAFNPCSRTPVAWKQELYFAARLLTQRTSKRIFVCANGGIDSEIVCRAFYDQGLPFTIFILRYDDDSNSEAVDRVRGWADMHNVPIDVVDLPMNTFIQNEVEAFAVEYRAVRPYRYLQLKLLELVSARDGFAVLGGGEQIYQIDTSLAPARSLNFEFSNETILPFRWCEHMEVTHEPYFYFSTPELVAAYMQLPLVAYAIQHPDVTLKHPISSSIVKRVAYLGEWPDIRARYRVRRSPKLRAISEDLRARFGEDFKKITLPVALAQKQLSAENNITTYE